MTQDELGKIFTWLKASENKISFGEVTISLIRHGGKTVRVEKSIIERELPEGVRP